MAYLPIIEVFKQRFGLEASDSDEDITRKVQGGLTALSPAGAAMAPYLLHLLVPGVDSGIPASTTPEAIKYRIFEALRVLLLEGQPSAPWCSPSKICIG